MTIDRIDNNGDYTPGNCRWVTHKTQMSNTRINRMIEYQGESKTLQQLADLYGISRAALTSRLKRGWDIEKALTTPVRKQTKEDTP